MSVRVALESGSYLRLYREPFHVGRFLFHVPSVLDTISSIKTAFSHLKSLELTGRMFFDDEFSFDVYVSSSGIRKRKLTEVVSRTVSCG
jgi:hypothetical protein